MPLTDSEKQELKNLESQHGILERKIQAYGVGIALTKDQRYEKDKLLDEFRAIGSRIVELRRKAK